MAKLKEAHKNQDLAAIDSAIEALNAAWQAASQDIYAQQQAQGAQGAGAQGAGAQGGAEQQQAQPEDVEFEEVKYSNRLHIRQKVSPKGLTFFVSRIL